MFHAEHHLTFRRAVAPQLVGHQHTRGVTQIFQQFAEESLGGSGVASALHQDIEHVPVLIDRPPEVMELAADPDENLGRQADKRRSHPSQSRSSARLAGMEAATPARESKPAP